jgi:CheY-like chemotaxis protein
MKQRVLVVDDDRLVADTLNLIFEANGYESQAAYSAEDGLLRARSFQPKLLLCDVSMPDHSGLQLVDQMSREMPECRMLMLSAYSNNALQVEQQAQRMKRPLKLLQKPCRPETLLQEATLLLRTA